MSRRVNPIVLLGFIVVLILSLSILASAQLGGGTASDAVGVGEAQMGKPFRMSTDGPNTFSCVGLMRHILRTVGVDANAPWVPEAYLDKYAPVDLANLQPGDIVIMPNWATMYVGNGLLLNANEATGNVTHTPLSSVTPLGAARPPYGGQPPVPTTDSLAQPTKGANDSLTQPIKEATDPLATKALDPMATEPTVRDPIVPDPMATDSLLADPTSGVIDPVPPEPLVTDPLPAADPTSETIEPVGDVIIPQVQF
jgi:hypothetical protein